MKRNHSGFTIVELLVVIVVISILAAITIVSYTGISNRANNSGTQYNLANASKKLKVYNIEHDIYPLNRGDAITAGLIPNESEYYYYVDNTTTPQTFCVTHIKNNVAYSVNQNGSPVPAPYCPVLYLDATNTTSYPGSGNTWYDLSGNGNNGVINGAIYSSSGGGAFNFDGIDDHINLSANPLLLTFGSEITIEAWINPDIVSGNRTAYGAGQGYNSFIFGAYDNRVFVRTSSASSFSDLVPTDAYVTVSIWNHIVTTRDNTGRKIYINGNTQPSWQDTNTYWTTTMTNPSAGARYNTSLFFDGKINGLRIYKKALSNSEITQNFNISRSYYGI